MEEALRSHFIQDRTIGYTMSGWQDWLFLRRIVYHQFPSVHVKVQPLLSFWPITVVVTSGSFLDCSRSLGTTIACVMGPRALFMFVFHRLLEQQEYGRKHSKVLEREFTFYFFPYSRSTRRLNQLAFVDTTKMKAEISTHAPNIREP